MRTLRGFALLALLSPCVALSLLAAPQTVVSPADLVVSASAANDRLRLSAGVDIAHMRLQVLAGGRLLYDSGWKSGNVLDWTLHDSLGLPLSMGSYELVAMSGDVAGHVSVHEGTLDLHSGELRIESADLVVARADTVPSVVRLAHNGESGQLVTTTGDLAFRFGDFLAQKDIELMRLTSAGNLGIGTDKPLARLDVIGLIRTSEGVMFPDGTIQRSAMIPGVVVTPGMPGYQPVSATAGAGTLNQIAKWIDNAGTLGDSAVTEVGGRVGIGTTTPGGLLHIFGAPTADIFSGMGPDVVTGPAMNYGYSGNSFGRGSGFFNVRPDAQAAPPNPSLRFLTLNQQRMIITNTGNIGIGLTTPSQKLEVAGSVKLSSGGSLIFPDATTMSTAGATLGSNTFSGDQNVTGNIHATGNITADGTLFGAVGSFNGNITSVNGVIDAGTQFDIAHSRVLSIAGVSNLFVGSAAGASNSTGQDNTFAGTNAGNSNTTGLFNSYYGYNAGLAADVGQDNSFFGFGAGALVFGSANSYFGSGAGRGIGAIVSGSQNSFFGMNAGFMITSGSQNAFFGESSGSKVSSGVSNTFIGQNAGANDTSGGANTFVGHNTGSSNSTDANNTFIGDSANGAAGITNATAIGADASVTQSNSLILGSITNINSAAASTKVGIGTTSPLSELEIRKDAAGALGPTLTLRNGAGNLGATVAIDFFTYLAGNTVPGVRIQTFDNAFSGDLVISNKMQNLAGGGSLLERFRITATGIVGIGTATPNVNTLLDVNGRVRVGQLGAATATTLCIDGTFILSACSSSIRYKDAVTDFGGGLDVIRRLRPVKFRWKTDGRADLGFIAEEVEKIEPLLATYDADGRVQGVKYDHVSVLLVDAIKQQQDELTAARDAARDLKLENEDLRVRVERLERALEQLTKHD